MGIDDPEQEENFVNGMWDAGAFLMGRNTKLGVVDEYHLWVLLAVTAFPSGVLEPVCVPAGE